MTKINYTTNLVEDWRYLKILKLLFIVFLFGMNFLAYAQSGVPWRSGGSNNTNLQSSTYQWGTFRGKACNFQVAYSTRNAGWASFVATHGPSGQPAAFTDPSIEILIQTSPFPEGNTYAALIAGSYDTYWQQIGTHIKNRVESGKPTIVSIAWEMNGTYMFWGGGPGASHYSSPAQYIAGYRRIVDQLRVTYPQVRTAWIINAHSTPAAVGTTNAWDLYPGNAYVTYVGTDDYDHYPPAPTKTAFDSRANANGGMYWLATQAAANGKQIIVGEWGVAPGSGSNGTGDNANYIQWMYETFLSWHNTGRIYAEYYFADPCGGGNVDSDLINCNPNARARYIQYWSSSGSGDTQAPSVPTGLASSSITQTSFTLSWTASTDNVGVTGYEVFRNGVSIGTPSTTSLNVTGLTCNTSYSMTVRARDAAGNWSAQSTALNVTTSSCTPDTQAPSVPTGLASSNIAQTSFTLSWTASTDNVGVTGYEVFRGGVSIGTPATTSFNVTGLTCNTAYSMTVRARDAAGNWSAQSSALNVTTSACSSGPSDEFNVSTLDSKWSWVRENAANWSLTAAPGNLRIILEPGDLNHNPADNKNLLIQNAPAGDWSIITKVDCKPNANWKQVGVIVYQDDQNYLKMVRLYNNAQQFQFAKEVAGTFTTGLVADGIASTISQLKITKIGSNYSGFYSADGNTWTQVWTTQAQTLSNIKIGILSANGGSSGTQNSDFDFFHFNVEGAPDTQAPTVPSGLASSNVAQTSFTLSWTASTDNVGVTGYEVFRGGVSIGTPATTSLNVTGLTCNTTYSMTVRARDAAGNWSAQSSAFNVTTSACSSGPSDEFNVSTLDPKWSWVRQNAANWSLTAAPGNMRIILEPGDLNHNPADNKNLLIQSAPTGDWSIITKVNCKPNANWKQVGVIVYQDDQNYLKMVRLYNNAQQFQFAKEAAGVWSTGLVADGIASTISQLKITKIGNNYSGYYSADGNTWTQVWTTQAQTLSNIKIGILSANGGSSGTQNSDFDFFHFDVEGGGGRVASRHPEETIIEKESLIFVTFPNPTNGLLHVQLPDDFKEGADLMIVNSVGRSVVEQKLLKKANTIDFSFAPSGMYVVKAFNGIRTVTQKIIKK